MANFPSRKPDAITGSQFIQQISGFKSGSSKRNELILEQIKSGNIPSFLRKFVPITVKEKNISLTYYCSPDYIAIGSDSDYIRISCDAPTSQAIANMFNCILPTKKMVDQIYQQAKTKANPAPMSGGASVSGKRYTGQEFINQKMQHADSLEEHNRMIERQLARLNHKPGDLVAGIKKDVVIGNKITNKPGRVNIYGWHTSDGKPIQPESTFHEAAYFDYSHSVRLIDKQCKLTKNGIQSFVDISTVLKDPETHNLISYERLLTTSYEEASPAKNKPDVSTTKVTETSGGFVRLQGRVPSAVVARAKSLLSKNMGESIVEEIDGKRYMFKLEPHYHPPGFKGGPIGWHKGVSVFIYKSQSPKEVIKETESINPIKENKDLPKVDNSFPKEELGFIENIKSYLSKFF